MACRKYWLCIFTWICICSDDSFFMTQQRLCDETYLFSFLSQVEVNVLFPAGWAFFNKKVVINLISGLAAIIGRGWLLTWSVSWLVGREATTHAMLDTNKGGYPKGKAPISSECDYKLLLRNTKASNVVRCWIGWRVDCGNGRWPTSKVRKNCCQQFASTHCMNILYGLLLLCSVHDIFGSWIRLF